MNLLIENWPLAASALLVALVILYFLLRRRQRVSLSDSAPVRPHMVAMKETGSAIANAATASPITARADVPSPLSSSAGDDLRKLKGVGPKLAALLNQHGITRFAQIASLTPPQVEQLDERLGPFRGRLSRDDVIAQAGYLARADIDGFEQRFGKL
ncbi:MAG: hypothetical protein ABIN83_04655 [Sphingomicrobium sp.]